MNIKIGGKDYTIEFTFEASLYGECTEKLASLQLGMSMAYMQANVSSTSEEEAKNNIKAALEDVVKSMSDLPQTVLTLFYAGLMEHHGFDGDKSVTSKADAKALMKTYFAENKDKDYYDLMNLLTEQMNEDDFFKKIGLDKMMGSMFGQQEAKKGGKK